jgi:hypothetical protein
MYLHVHRIIKPEEQRVYVKVVDSPPSENTWSNQAWILLKQECEINGSRVGKGHFDHAECWEGCMMTHKYRGVS